MMLLVGKAASPLALLHRYILTGNARAFSANEQDTTAQTSDLKTVRCERNIAREQLKPLE